MAPQSAPRKAHHVQRASSRFVVAAVLAVALSACGDRDRVVHAVLPTARGLREGAPVRYRGIEVGQVSTVRFVDTGVQLELDIKRADAPLRTADQVRIVPSGIFGDNEVEIVPGPASAPTLATNGSLAAFPPDTLEAIRNAMLGALAREAFAQFNTRDSASRPQKRADSLRPPATRSHP